MQIETRNTLDKDQAIDHIKYKDKAIRLTTSDGVIFIRTALPDEEIEIISISKQCSN